MRYQKWVAVLGLLSFVKPTFAGDTVPSCQPLRWQGATEKELMQMQFGEMARTNLVQIAWGESLSDPHHSIAVSAWYYLYSTEDHPELKSYFLNVANELGAGKHQMRELAARYPIRKGNAKAKTSLKELCAGYAKAQATKIAALETSYEGAPRQ